MPTVCTLLWSEIEEELDFHAALAAMPVLSVRDIPLHDHDFYEMMFIISGTGWHWVNEKQYTFSPGDLWLVRARDSHAIGSKARQLLRFINVAFPANLWWEFGDLLGERRLWERWEKAAAPPLVRLTDEKRARCERLFQRVLLAYHDRGTRLDLFRFWGETIPLLQVQDDEENTETGLDGTTPEWLLNACRMMYDEEALRQGLPFLLRASGVSLPHLCRTMQAHGGVTPTGWINELRLRRAARLLTSTTHDVAEVAFRCGFHSASHFYALFRTRFGETPNAHRRNAHRAVLPLAEGSVDGSQLSLPRSKPKLRRRAGQQPKSQ